MINFRVANLQRMVAQLKAAGIAVDVDATTYPNGRFAHLKDPEGNPIELWEPRRRLELQIFFFTSAPSNSIARISLS